MPLRRAVRGRPARRNVEPQEQGVPNAPEVQPQGEVTNAKYCEAIRMLSHAVTNQVGQRENRQEEADTSRIREFLRMNPPSITSSSVTEDPKNFVEEPYKVFELMLVVDAKRVELAAYQLMGVARIWFDQWKKTMVEDAPLVSWACFEEAFLGHFFHRELREAKLRLTTTKNVNELWLLKNALLSVGGSMRCHPCIAQVDFERGYGVLNEANGEC
ncbi:hypothetical protein MTR67_044068 [Solanum verrucosum]|uniref:Gag-pol polyprotein n=1 Tax=Solanum verrucosum TaxID=315347 RepID=A0AAF0USN3_SOLVR|nr:hypothetical protein MTR67_044068 [Solanum verrucosum]